MFDPNSLYEGFEVKSPKSMDMEDWVHISYKEQMIFRFKKKNLDLFTMDSNRCFSYDLPDAEGAVKKRVVFYINDLGYVKKCEEEKDNFGIWVIKNDKRVDIKKEAEVHE